MVYVNNKKFACESCIKGHRSSACHHTDRPLFEIKKKGRPVSQCTKCRELRQSKRQHSKCTCDDKVDDAPLMQPLSKSSGSKSRRFIPIIPALPNGLKDVVVVSQSSTTLPPDSGQQVDSLLNPCNCKNVWKCRCKNSQSTISSIPSVQMSASFDGLATLARAASMQSSLLDVPQPSSSAGQYSRPVTPPKITFGKQQKESATLLSRSLRPDLAPLRLSPSSSLPVAMPDFPSMPSMKVISSLAGSGCTCGVRCACPGCVEHDAENGSGKRNNCGEGCGACIDHSIEVALPDVTPSQAKESTRFLDRFFARAAALPPPPAHRRMSSHSLDLMNTDVYVSPSKPPGSQPFTFGVISLPKLECCGGRCACPPGECTCRATCAGCLDGAHDRKQAESTQTLDDTMPAPRKPPGD